MKFFPTLCLLLLCSVGVFAQAPAPVALPVDAETKKVTYTEVVPAEGVSQAELYSRGRLWLANAFRSAKDAVQLEDKESGVVSGRGWQDIQILTMGHPVSIMLWYKVTIATKEGRYKYDLSDFAIQYHATPQYPTTPVSPAENFLTDQLAYKKKPDTYSPQVRQQIEQVAKQLQADIKAVMQKPASGTANGKDW